jgi:(p)ppGpp synthase/HD superfamily hydrolase
MHRQNIANLGLRSREFPDGHRTMSTLERAIEIAAKAHSGQTDKGGDVYILHPLRVMLRLSSAEARIAAVLHDVVEDSDITIDFLRQEGFSEQVLTAIESLTKRKGEDYAAFIERFAQDSVARQVKVEDLRDNMDLSRLGQKPLEKDLVRQAKYAKALARLRASEESLTSKRAS